MGMLFDELGFNTQPPEGGWGLDYARFLRDKSFNTQPPEGGWQPEMVKITITIRFQHTAARRRLAFVGRFAGVGRSFNTQPPEGGWSPERR